MIFQRFFPLSFSFFLFFPLLAQACPSVAGLSDYNCDGRIKITVTGDSVVQGFGDSENGNSGGYVKRFKENFPAARVVNQGVYAITTKELLSKHRRGEYLTEISGSDIVLIDAGRNDCRTGETTQRTIRDLKRLVTWLRRNNDATTAHDRGSSAEFPEKQPFVFLASQIPHRDYRRSCLEQLNADMLRSSSSALPVYLRFDKLPSSILSSDGLHPSSSGYSRMAARLGRYAQGGLVTKINHSRPDFNLNGIYDLFEGLF